MSARLAGRHVLVVGGGQRDYGQEQALMGIGRAIALQAAIEGAAVAVADVELASAQETVDLISEQGGHALAIELDVTDEESVAAGVSGAAEVLGALDGLVMNTGIVAGWGVENTSAADWDRVFAVNVRGHFLGCKHALAIMGCGAAITLTSSTAAILPSTSEIPAYGASKSALDGVSRYVAKAGAERGVRVNTVMPGLIDTPLGRLASQAKSDRDDTPIPLGRQGSAHDIAQATTFLLSSEAGYITGQTLVVDGGLSALG